MKLTTLLRQLVLGFLLASPAARIPAADAPDALAVGNGAMQRGDIDAAITSYTAAIQSGAKDPNLDAAYFARGQAYVLKGNWAQAIADLSAALESNPAIAEAHYARAVAYANTADLDHAWADATAAIRLRPPYAAAYCLRGGLYAQKGEDAKAMADFTQCIQLDPRIVYAYLGRSSLHQTQADYALAIQDLQEALRLSPDSDDALNGLAWNLATAPDPTLRNGARALQYAQKVCDQTHWKNAGYLDTLAAVYAEIGDFEEAVKWQQKAVALAGADVHADELRDHLKLYLAKQPYHEPVKAPAKPAAKP